jgi:EAL domain-containing protein (putative c-di-GMP-specific phosphodiesterase class I)
VEIRPSSTKASGKEDTKLQEFDEIWARHIKAALMDDRFRLAQLPVAGLRSDSVQMFDLLVRMLDEHGNSVLPSEFIPAANRIKMMKNIDRWMLTAAVGFCMIRPPVATVDHGSDYRRLDASETR